MLDGLEFNDEQVIDEKIDSVPDFELKSVIGYGESNFGERLSSFL